jgi:hypothetical protein
MRTCVVQAGQRWKHFKGYIYEIVCIAARELDQQLMVVYREASGSGTIWTRPLLEFIGETHDTHRNPDGSLAVSFQKRFTLVSEPSVRKVEESQA